MKYLPEKSAKKLLKIMLHSNKQQILKEDRMMIMMMMTQQIQI